MAKRAKKTKPAAEETAEISTATAAAPEKPQVVKARAFAIEAARMLDDDKCEEIAVLDVRGLSHLSDFIVIGSGTSDRQMRSAAADVMEMGKKSGHISVRQNVDERTTWYVVDFVDVMVHVFEPNTRAYYDIEMMWGDAPRLEWKRVEGEKLTPKTRVRSTAKAQRDGKDD